MAKISAGILLYRMKEGTVEVFLVHPGGPLWSKKDLGAWSIPKGLLEPGEEALAAAMREFEEETGFAIAGHFIPLEPVKTPGGKVILAWAVEADCDPLKIRSNLFEMEWPPHSGRTEEFPEIDRAGWFTIADAKKRINKAQAGLLDGLERVLEQKTGTATKREKMTGRKK